MPIPKFDEHGNLPVGIHTATMVEIKQRFAYNKCRQRLYSGLLMLAKHLKSVGCKTLYLDGSFVSAAPEPGDYDAVWEFDGVGNSIDPLLRQGWDLKAIKRKFGGDVFCRMPDVLGMDHVEVFQRDRAERPKGIIKIDLRTVR